MTITAPKCPKCSASPTQYREENTISMNFELTNGRFNQTAKMKDKEEFEAGFGHPTDNVDIEWEMSDPSPTGKVIAECDCGHHWRLRNVTSIEALIKAHGYNPSV